MSLDEEKGMVFIPTGSVSSDFYGGKRLGDGLFGNCILALDAATGKRIWHFRPCIMTCGTETRLRHLYWSVY